MSPHIRQPLLLAAASLSLSFSFSLSPVSAPHSNQAPPVITVPFLPLSAQCTCDEQGNQTSSAAHGVHGWSPIHVLAAPNAA
jgi:hypothetical protein